MPVTPDGKIIDDKGNPTGQTVNVNTGVVSGAQNNPPQNVSASQNTVPTNNLNTPALPTTTNPATSATPATSLPTTNLQPGAQGPNVAALQDFLKSIGYLTPQQISTGPGVYGPQTTAAVSKFQQAAGINAGQYPGYFGPLTRQAMQEKYQAAFKDVQGQAVPNNNVEASAALADTKKEDPQKAFMDSYFAMNPMMKTLYDTLNNTLSASATKQSFVDEFKQLREQAGIPELQTQFLNIKNVMRGTENDIRDEITKAGGTATESQIQAMTGARNRILMKQAQYLSDALNVQNGYVDQVVKLSEADREQVNKDLDRKIGLTEKMATIQTDLNNAARGNYEKIVENIGYDGLAQTLQGTSDRMRYVESLMGLPSGSLSNPTFIANAKTMKEQTLALGTARLAQGQQRIAISLGDIQSSKQQDKLEQNYRQTLTRAMAMRSGGLGLEDQKVNQAIHLEAIFKQNMDKNGNFTIPPTLYSELALGLARLISPNGQVGIELERDIKQASLQGNLGNVMTYITGTPVTGSSQAILKMMHDSISRQGEVAEDNREGYMSFIRSTAPTDLEEGRRSMLETGMLNSYRSYRDTGRQNNSVGTVTPMVGPDGKPYNVPNNKIEAFIKAGGKRQ